MKPAELEQLVVEYEGVAKSGVVKGLSYLVTNSTEKIGNYVKAQQQETKIILEQKFLEMIE